MMKKVAIVRILLGILIGAANLPGPAFAAEPDPIADAPKDSSSVWHAVGDVAWRYDHVTGLNQRDDLSRLKFRGRFGWQGAADDWQAAFIVKAGAGSDHNRDNRRNNDNEHSDGFGLDKLEIAWRAPWGGTIMAGKSELPLALTPLTWDQDLRPFGLGYRHEWASASGNRFDWIAGCYRTDHLYREDSRLCAAQARSTTTISNEAEVDAALAWLGFDHLQKLILQGLTRTNARLGSSMLSDYRLLDFQLGLRHRMLDRPMHWRLDLVKNLGADRNGNGIRASGIWGDRALSRSWEFGLAFQRIQQDAVLAAFNADDWWFHSQARGVMPWVAYGFSEHWSMQLAGFYERHDHQRTHTKRALLDINGNW